MSADAPITSYSLASLLNAVRSKKVRKLDALTTLSTCVTLAYREGLKRGGMSAEDVDACFVQLDDHGIRLIDPQRKTEGVASVAIEPKLIRYESPLNEGLLDAIRRAVTIAGSMKRNVEFTRDGVRTIIDYDMTAMQSLNDYYRDRETFKRPQELTDIENRFKGLMHAIVEAGGVTHVKPVYRKGCIGDEAVIGEKWTVTLPFTAEDVEMMRDALRRIVDVTGKRTNHSVCRFVNQWATYALQGSPMPDHLLFNPPEYCEPDHLPPEQSSQCASPGCTRYGVVELRMTGYEAASPVFVCREHFDASVGLPAAGVSAEPTETLGGRAPQHQASIPVDNSLDISSWSLKPGDVLLARVPFNWNSRTVSDVRSQLEEAFPNNPSILVPSGFNMAAVGDIASDSGVGAYLIARERRRQWEQEGFDDTHDDLYGSDPKISGTFLVDAAICYATPADRRRDGDRGIVSGKSPPYGWPFSYDWWKPTPDDRVRELTKAGALIAAEIDRILRMRGTAGPIKPLPELGKDVPAGMDWDVAGGPIREKQIKETLEHFSAAPSDVSLTDEQAEIVEEALSERPTVGEYRVTCTACGRVVTLENGCLPDHKQLKANERCLASGAPASWLGAGGGLWPHNRNAAKCPACGRIVGVSEGKLCEHLQLEPVAGPSERCTASGAPAKWLYFPKTDYRIGLAVKPKMRGHRFHGQAFAIRAIVPHESGNGKEWIRLEKLDQPGFTIVEPADDWMTA